MEPFVAVVFILKDDTFSFFLPVPDDLEEER
uniref:Uncharacterized protein n=1 Tax=Rhizophora mucronata TaxID=61149 RepID=A0A2P2IWS0_RHIMU